MCKFMDGGPVGPEIRGIGWENRVIGSRKYTLDEENCVEAGAQGPSDGCLTRI